MNKSKTEQFREWAKKNRDEDWDLVLGLSKPSQDESSTYQYRNTRLHTWDLVVEFTGHLSSRRFEVYLAEKDLGHFESGTPGECAIKNVTYECLVKIAELNGEVPA